MKKHRLLVLNALALGLHLLFSPWAFPMGIGDNDPPIISSVTANPNPASPGGQSQLTCIATDPDGTVTKYEWTASGGTFPNGGLTQTVLAPINNIVWRAPTTPGYYNITIKVYDNGSAFGGAPATATSYLTIFLDGSNNSPVITSLIPETDSVFLGASIFVIASATDPDGDPITFHWTASGGDISGDNDADPEAIIWTAPQRGGDQTITVTAIDGQGGQAAQSVSVNVTVAREAGYIRTPYANPVRITSDNLGQIYVSDTHKNLILVYDSAGNFIREISGLGAPLGLAVGPDGKLYVGDDEKDQVSVYTTSGSLLGTLNGPAIQMPNSIDIDPAVGKLFVADSKAATVLVFDLNGSFQYSINGSSAVSGGFIFPVSVGVDPASRTLYVCDGGTYQIYGLDYSGNLKSKFGSMGKGAGQFSRPQGLTVDSIGRVFVVDAYQSFVQVFGPNGQFLESVGTYGTAKGSLSVPMDAQVDKLNRLLVTSNDNSRIEVYGLDDVITPLPNSPPTEPLLSSPPNGSEVGTYSPTLVALPATDADGDVLTYDFEVYGINQLDPIASVSDIPEAQGQVSWSLQVALSENTFYQWRARAFDGAVAGPWTSEQSFYVNAINELPSTPPQILVTPGIELRPNGSLAWSASSDPDAKDLIHYVLEIDENPDFSNVLIREEYIQSTSIMLESLAGYDLLVDDTLYYWRVKAVDNHGGESAWADGSFYFNRIEIEVTSAPSDAGVYIDGNPAYPGWRATGATPTIVADVRETMHVVTVIKEGYESVAAIADNRNGADAQISVTLKPAVQPLLGSRLTKVLPQEGIYFSRPFIMDWSFIGVLDSLLSDSSGTVHIIFGGDIPTYGGVLLETAAVFGTPVQNASVFAVDWDDDADFDLLIGNKTGTVLLAVNAGDQGIPDFVNGGAIRVSGRTLMLAAYSAPAVVDWNNDGKKDLIVGSSSGTIGLYINTGTDAAPEFASEKFLQTLSGQLVVPSGNSVPFVTDWNGDGLNDLLVGSSSGAIYLYLNIGTPDSPILKSQGSVYYLTNSPTRKLIQANPGPNSTPYVADCNGDGLRDVVTGNAGGKIVLFPGIPYP